MGRTTIRTANLTLDMIGRLRSLFGTIKNAHVRLGLDGLVDYQTFYRAMHFGTILPVHKDHIEQAWERWGSLFLNPAVPASEDFTLTPTLHAEWPEWHSQYEPEDE